MPALAPLPPADSISLRAIRWKHPRRTYPTVIELGLSRLTAAIDKPNSAQWKALFGGAPVPGKERERRKRSDGATNVVSVMATMIASADLVRGLVATPAADGWDRKTWYDVDALAFGPLVPGERGLRRTERAAAELEAQGFIRSIPWRVITSEGVRAVPGLKFITDKLWKALGLWDAVRSERRRRRQRQADTKKAELDAAIGASVKRHPRAPQEAAPRAAPHSITVPARPPPSQAGPKAVGELAAAEIAKLKKILGE